MKPNRRIWYSKLKPLFGNKLKRAIKHSFRIERGIMSKQKPRQEIPKKNDKEGTRISIKKKKQYLCSKNING